MQTFLNLLSVATADHQLTEREIKFLSARARQLGLTNHQFNVAVNHALEHPGEVKIPRGKAQRLELLAEMLRLMAADGELAEVEKQLFAIVAAHMKVGRDEINSLIDTLLADAAETPATPAPARPPKKPARAAQSSPQEASTTTSKAPATRSPGKRKRK